MTAVHRRLGTETFKLYTRLATDSEIFTMLSFMLRI